MTPGTYLRKRREAASMTTIHAAEILANLPIATGHDANKRQAMLIAILRLVEADRATLTPEQALIVKDAFPFSISIYIRLVQASTGHVAGKLPRLCNHCACSTFDPCITHTGACAWSERSPNLCTACEHTVADRHLGPAASAQTTNAFYHPQPMEAAHG